MRAMYVIILTAACQRRQLKDPPLAFHSLYAALHELPARKYQEFKTSTQCKVSSTRLTTVDILVQDLRLYCSVIKCPTLPEHLYSSFDQSSADQQLYKAVYCGLPGQSTLTRRATVMWFTVTLLEKKRALNARLILILQEDGINAMCKWSLLLHWLCHQIYQLSYLLWKISYKLNWL